MSAISTSNEREINPMQLSIEQLYQLKQQHEDEITDMQKQLDSLATARNRFLGAKSALNDIAITPEDNFLYVPLSSSLYVPGKPFNRILFDFNLRFIFLIAISFRRQSGKS